MPQVASHPNVSSAPVPNSTASAAKGAKQASPESMFAALVEDTGTESILPPTDGSDPARVAPARLDGLLHALRMDGPATAEALEAPATDGDDKLPDAEATAALPASATPSAMIAAVDPILPAPGETMTAPPSEVDVAATASLLAEAATVPPPAEATSLPPAESRVTPPSNQSVIPLPEKSGPLADLPVQPMAAAIQQASAAKSTAGDAVADPLPIADTMESADAAKPAPPHVTSANGRPIGHAGGGEKAPPSTPAALEPARPAGPPAAQGAADAAPAKHAEPPRQTGAARHAATTDKPASTQRHAESASSPAIAFSATLDSAVAADPKTQAPAIQTASLPVAAPAAADPAPAPSGPVTLQQTTAAVPIAGVAVEIAARAKSDGNRFEIRLDPPELGRIDVRLDIDSQGQVTSRLVVDKAETLDLLRRDVHQLERALQDAGLKISDSSLNFSLRDHAFAGRNGERDGRPAAQLIIPEPDALPADVAPTTYGRLGRLGGGVDIRV